MKYCPECKMTSRHKPDCSMPSKHRRGPGTYNAVSFAETNETCLCCGRLWGKHRTYTYECPTLDYGAPWHATNKFTCAVELSGYEDSFKFTSPNPDPTPPQVGIKHDSKKPKLSQFLHPLFANVHFTPIVLALTEVLKYGAEKYTANNWTQVTPKERYAEAAIRHLSAALHGKWLDDEADPEGNPGSGLPHVAHAACSALMYGALAIRDRKD